MPDYKPGAKREEMTVVGDENAISFLGPAIRVLATSMMIRGMEGVCRNLILTMLDPGQDSVGTHVNVSHNAAAPFGSTVIFEAELLAVNDRRAEFAVKCLMGETLIGEGTHQRTIINVNRFLEKLNQAA